MLRKIFYSSINYEYSMTTRCRVSTPKIKIERIYRWLLPLLPNDHNDHTNTKVGLGKTQLKRDKQSIL
jgi:hypothetical protein